MLEAIYTIISIIVFFKLLKFMFKAAWGITKFVVGLIFWPIIILVAVMGLIWIAIPILIIVGILTSVVSV